MILTLPKTQKWFMIKLLYSVDQGRFFICIFVANVVINKQSILIQWVDNND